MTDNRDSLATSLDQLFLHPVDDIAGHLRAFVDPDVIWDVSHPINRLEGVDAVAGRFIVPLRQALAGARRRNEIVIGGINAHDGCEWIAAFTHYVGNFRAPLFGIPASDGLVFLRSGEFYKVEEGRIREARLIVDFLDLMRQANVSPVPHELGTEMLYPGPATHDGVLPGNRDRGTASMRLVDAMLADLRDFDARTFASENQTGDDGYWDENMFWYGPGGIGSNYRWSGFQKDHRIPFLKAFPDRKGGNRFCEFGDGDYATLGGWPSMTMTHKGEYLGIAPTGKKLTLRVMDIYRCADGKIAENWVFLDYLDLLRQMGVPVLAEAPSSDPAA